MRARAVLLIVFVALAGASSASAAPHLYPRPKPLERMSLAELAHWQAAAHGFYRGKVRAWIRRPGSPPVRLPALADEIVSTPPALALAAPPPPPKCKAAGMRLPKDVCWYARAARWTAREIAATRRAITRARAAPSAGYSGGSVVALGQRMAAARGWVGGEWDDLYTLWMHESGWDPTRQNPTSAACGIPQAMNYCAYGHDPATQIGWGLSYIAGRYGRPSAALAHWSAYNWY